MRTLDKQDSAWAYLKTTYDAVKTIKDVVESVVTQEYWDAFMSAKEGVDGFIENYVKIEEALDLVDKGDLFKAGIKASEVLNDLRQTLYSAPDLPDIQSDTEMCLALMSFTEMMHATENKMQEPANEWVKRSLGHARRE